VFLKAWLNLGSLALGLLAWALAAVNLLRCHEAGKRNGVFFSAASLSACAASLCLQIFSIEHLVKSGDWSALLDTVPAVARAAALLLAVTVILNAITLGKYHNKKSTG